MLQKTAEMYQQDKKEMQYEVRTCDQTLAQKFVMI